LAEIIALEQERLAGRLRRGVGKAVTIVQAGFVPTLPKIEEGLPGKLSVLDRHRLDHDAGATEKGFRLSLPSGPSWFSITIDSST
jgi:hypothetical protein